MDPEVTIPAESVLPPEASNAADLVDGAEILVPTLEVLPEPEPAPAKVEPPLGIVGNASRNGACVTTG